ncbi:MAG TPA: DNA repair protein RecN, partial [Thiotrichales bacterium]|nr:DNA repair protein RecN [Thiotrichales bacterium]
AAVQRQLLDDYAGHHELIEKVSNQFVELKLVEEQYQHLLQASSERNDRLDLLRFQTRELDELALEEDEYTELNTRHQRMANAETLLNSVQQSMHVLSEEENGNTQSQIAFSIAALEKSAEVDAQLLPAIELLQSAQIQVDECVSLLQNYRDGIELDPQQLAETEARLQQILDLSRKHQVQPEQLHQTHQALLKALNDIDHADERLDELATQCRELEERYLDACKTLSKSRLSAAKKLNKKITTSMQTLGMTGGRFEIEINPLERSKASAHGLDKIEFRVMANSGQPCKPIARVASGGELARISLAIQMIIARTSKIPSLIFDEVDSGVGGGIAEIVGQHLRTLGENNQVICITHLPQVASQGHHHLRVEKQTRSNKTRSRVVPLDPTERIEEIARMLSGVDITQQSLAHAEEMLERAK